jgi:hypothetical protein
VKIPPQTIIDPEHYPQRRIATILVFWDGEGLMNGYAEQDMFSGEKSTQVFYGENSYGKELMVGKVFGPYQIDDPGGCNPSMIAQLGRQAMVDKGHNPFEFEQFMYHFPGIGGCGFAGLASVGNPLHPAADSWYNGSFGCVVRNQELGHNYGMGHSHAQTCVVDGEQVPLADDCEHIEYGDPYDPMGGGCGHINVVQKGYMGWLEGCNIVTTTTDGRFNLLPTELPCNGTQALRFEAYDGRYYYLEYRQRIGKFDGPAGHDGVLLHIAGGISSPPSPYILDVGQNGWLHSGDTYTDPQNGVSFTVVDEQSSHATIEVNFPDGGDGAPPTCIDGSAPLEEAGAIGSLECAEIPYPEDLQAPTVQITYPADGDVFEPGASFVITADVADDRQIAEIELYIDGEASFRIFEPPWEWEVNEIPEGEYELGIVANDGRNWTPSNAVNIIVTDDPIDDDEGDTDGDDTSAGGTTTDGDTGGDAAPDDDTDPGAQDGCGCTTDHRPAPLFTLLLLPLAYLRRRRD